jgi:hypothetical protein
MYVSNFVAKFRFVKSFRLIGGPLLGTHLERGLAVRPYVKMALQVIVVQGLIML